MFAFAVTAAEQIDPETYQRVVDENIALRQEQTRLARESNDLRRKNAGLILDIQELEGKRDQLASLVAQLKTPEETRNELMRLQSERVVFVREIERLRQSLSAITPAPSNAPPPVAAPEQGSSLFRKIEQENAELRQQVAQVREAVQAAEKVRDTLTARDAEQRGRIERLSADLASLKGELAQAKAKEAAAWRAVDKIARKSYQQQVETEKLKDELARREAAREQSSRAPKPSATAPTNPGDTAGLLRAAQRAFKSGRPKEAEKLYLEALAQTPADALIHYNLGVIYGDYLKEASKAVYHYRRYLDLNPLARDASRVRSWILQLEIEAVK